MNDRIQLRWDTWNEACEFLANAGYDMPKKARGVYVDRAGVPHKEHDFPEANPRIGLLIARDDFGYFLAVENDWLVKTDDDKISVVKVTV